MTRRRRALVALVVCGAVAAWLGPTGLRVARLARAVTRSTSQFTASASDPRVLYEPGAEHAASVLASAMPAAIEAVEGRQGGPFEIPVRVYLCATIASFTSYGADPRAGGLTLAGRVFLSPKPENTDERLPRVLTHELSHLHLLQRRTLLDQLRLPVWFVEGLAVDVSGGGGAEGVSGDDVRRAVHEGRAFVPATDGGLFHRPGAGAYGLDEHLFYAEAGAFLAYVRSVDPQRFQAFLGGVEDGASLGPAFQGAYGAPIEASWRAFVERAAGW